MKVPHPNGARAAWGRVRPEELKEGRLWYPREREWILATTPAELELELAVGAYAQLSPRCPWAENRRRFAALVAGEPVRGLFVERARAILRGEAEPGGPKVRAFAAALADPERAEEPVVDSHVWRACGGDPSAKVTPARHREVARILRRLADRVGEHPLHVQAAIWCAARRERS